MDATFVLLFFELYNDSTIQVKNLIKGHKKVTAQ